MEQRAAAAEGQAPQPSTSHTSMSPALPPVFDSLPIMAAGDDEPSDHEMQIPRYRSSRDYQRKHSNRMVDNLSRRLSRQNLIPSSAPDFALDMDSDSGSMPARPSFRSSKNWVSRSSLSYPVVEAPERELDPLITARVLERLQNNASSPPAPSPQPASPGPSKMNDIEIDVDKMEIELEADEGCDAEDEFAWLENNLPLGSGLAGALRNHGVLRFSTSSEAALKCPKLVRNVPRMRKRKDKKKEYRRRTAALSDGEEAIPVVA